MSLDFALKVGRLKDQMKFIYQKDIQTQQKKI